MSMKPYFKDKIKRKTLLRQPGRFPQQNPSLWMFLGMHFKRKKNIPRREFWEAKRSDETIGKDYGKIWGFPDSSAGKESACNTGDPSSIPGLGRSLDKRKDDPLQYSGLENSMDCIPWGHKESDMTEQISLFMDKYKNNIAHIK